MAWSVFMPRSLWSLPSASLHVVSIEDRSGSRQRWGHGRDDPSRGSNGSWSAAGRAGDQCRVQHSDSGQRMAVVDRTRVPSWQFLDSTPARFQRRPVLGMPQAWSPIRYLDALLECDVFDRDLGCQPHAIVRQEESEPMRVHVMRCDRQNDRFAMVRASIIIPASRVRGCVVRASSPDKSRPRWPGYAGRKPQWSEL